MTRDSDRDGKEEETWYRISEALLVFIMRFGSKSCHVRIRLFSKASRKSCDEVKCKEEGALQV